MTEPKTPSVERYVSEARYMQALKEHSDNFDTLVSSVPEDRADMKETMMEMYHPEPGILLDRDKLKTLKDQNLRLFDDVSRVYLPFLKDMAGLS